MGEAARAGGGSCRAPKYLGTRGGDVERPNPRVVSTSGLYPKYRLPFNGESAPSNHRVGPHQRKQSFPRATAYVGEISTRHSSLHPPKNASSPSSSAFSASPRLRVAFLCTATIRATAPTTYAPSSLSSSPDKPCCTPPAQSSAAPDPPRT